MKFNVTAYFLTEFNAFFFPLSELCLLLLGLLSLFPPFFPPASNIPSYWVFHSFFSSVLDEHSSLVIVLWPLLTGMNF